ncbi:MAG TPA: hypothetical protein VM661_15405 [Candidatus Sulfotelmatobacter sp.]|jgi:hypothetical protein|nr:hypothetical protein [Candidatus Sulfotelmatobacter sp.]
MFCGLSITERGSEGFDLQISKGRLVANEIIDSSTSPPGRYVLEVGRRVLKAKPQTALLAVGNPLLPLTSAQISAWLGTIASPTVLADSGDFPLIYVLPREMFEDWGRFLTLLSAADAKIDARLLAGVLGRPVAVVNATKLPKIGRYPVSTATGWFQGRDRQSVLKMLALNATRLVEEPGGRWKSLPFAVFHPYHAGSIVFFAAAARKVAAPLYQQQVVCSSYRDIWDYAKSPLDAVWLKLPWLPRDNSVGEPQYALRSFERLGQQVMDNTFISFNRYSRTSGAASFHRIDHDRFALGDSLDSGEDTSQWQASDVRGRCVLPPAPLKVLFHINGGLPIKSYPDDHSQVLFRALQGLGIRASVVGHRPDLEAFGVTSVEADETELLFNAVRDHHVFVGLDSFPHHFVRNVMGWPTIGLFGNTLAANFGGGWNEQYRTLDASLPCNPCGGESKCPLFGRKECANYAGPGPLISAIVEMGRRLYGYHA